MGRRRCIAVFSRLFGFILLGCRQCMRRGPNSLPDRSRWSALEKPFIGVGACKKLRRAYGSTHYAADCASVPYLVASSRPAVVETLRDGCKSRSPSLACASSVGRTRKSSGLQVLYLETAWRLSCSGFPLG